MERTIDELTGIYTFKSFIDATHEMLINNMDKRYVLLVWDIEHFKIINEVYGMECGDALLCEIAKHIQNDIHGIGTYGRIGSDKFVCCYEYENFNEEDVMNKMNEPHKAIDNTYKVIMQAGVYISNDNTIPVIRMCDRAIIALNTIKGRYTEKIAIYNESNRDEIVTDQQLISDLDEAINTRQFYVVIQPIYRAKDNRIMGGEVLVRWNHPQYGLLAPYRFIPLFEKNHLITKLDSYVWEEACRIVKRMQDMGQRLIPLSINVSRANILYKNIGDILSSFTHKYNISPKYIRVEITESAYMDNPELLVTLVKDLKRRGFCTLIDDFGTGFSSLNMLRDSNFDILKIDKNLIDEIVTDERAGNVVSGIAHMARRLNMEVVAEGIEHYEQATFIRNVGCTYIQGYLYSKPITEEEFVNERKTTVKILSRDIDYIDLEDIFSISSPEKRELLDDLLGPIVLCELKERDISILNVNDEYTKMFKTGFKDIANGDITSRCKYPQETKDIVIDACIEAKKIREINYTEIFKVDVAGIGRWLGIKIKYVGTRNKTDLYILAATDITKEANERKSSEQCLDILPNL